MKSGDSSTMDAAQSAGRGWRAGRMLGLAVLCAVAVGYLWFVRKNCSPYASNADASCYLNEARLFLAGKLKVPVAPMDGLSPPEWDYSNQLPLDFRLIDGREMTPIGSPGYPLLLCAASFFVGLDWSVVPVNVIAAGAAGLLMVLLARRFGLPWVWAFAAAALVWTCPVFVYLSLQPMTDVPSMAWCMAAIWLAWMARDHWAWAVAAGFAVGVAVLVRPANVMLVAPVAVLLGCDWRRWVGLAIGGAPCAIFQLWFNHRLFHALLTTGYGNVDFAFGLRYLGANATYFAWQLPLQLSPLVVLGALGLPWLWRRLRFEVTVLVVWTAAFVGFYLTCFFSAFPWSIRYLMPVFPALIIAAMLVARAGWQRCASPRGRQALAVVLLAMALAWQWQAGRRLHVVIMKRGEIIYVQVAAWMREHAPRESIVIGKQVTGAFYYYTDFSTVRHDLMDPAAVQRLYAVAARNGRPVYAVLFDPERERAFARLPGQWTELARIGAMTVWKLTAAP